MKLYISTISIAVVIICAANIAFGIASPYYVIAATVWCVALQFALDGAVAITVNKMPDRYFLPDNRAFRISDFEKNLYKSLQVRRWKDKVWELGSLGGFSKRTLSEPDNPEYIRKFIIECNKGVTTHRLSYPIGFLAMLTLSGVCTLTVAIPVATVNLILNVLPTIVLRYNTPKLFAVLRRLERKGGQRAGAAASDAKEGATR